MTGRHFAFCMKGEADMGTRTRNPSEHSARPAPHESAAASPFVDATAPQLEPRIGTACTLALERPLAFA